MITCQLNRVNLKEAETNDISSTNVYNEVDQIMIHLNDPDFKQNDTDLKESR